MSLPALSLRRSTTAETVDAVTSVPGETALAPLSGFRAPLSGFSITDPVPSSAARAQRPTLRAVAGGIHPLPIGLGTSAAVEEVSALPSVADAIPIDGSWRWLGLLSCWLSSALVASVLVVALH